MKYIQEICSERLKSIDKKIEELNFKRELVNRTLKRVNELDKL